MDIYQFVLTALVILCAGLSLVLLFICIRQNRKIDELQSRIIESNSSLFTFMEDEAQVADEKFQQLSDAYVSETVRIDNSLRHTENALLSMMSQISQSQTTIIESMQRQLVVIGKNQDDRLNTISHEISEKLGIISAQTEQMREWLSKSMSLLRQENTQQLNEIRGTVDEKLTSALDKKLTTSFAQVSERLEQVYKGLGEMHTLANGVGDLKKVLTNVKTRGIWGEMQVDSIIRQVLSPNQYDTNVAVVPGASERVEFAIRLPGQNGNVIYLPIDSKFPQEDYLRLTSAYESGDSAQVESSKKAIIQRIRIEARRISDKYVHPSYTTDFAVMFLPVEGLYSEVVQLPGLVEELQNSMKIVVSGPSTFSALLNALQMGFRTLAIEQRSSEVWRLLGQVKSDFGKFADTLMKTRQRLQQASDSLDSAYTRTVSMQRKLGSVESLELQDNDTPDEGVAE